MAPAWGVVQAAKLPKPLAKIGDKPVLSHLMELCATQGAVEFIIALGHNRHKIEDYFRNASSSGHLAQAQDARPADWSVNLVDTGLQTMTGGRLKRLSTSLRGEPYFLMTYADGLSDINLNALEQFHTGHGKLATITAVRVPERFGRLKLDRDVVTSFQEKPDDRPWINGGFFVLSPKVLDYIEGDTTNWEHEPLQRLCAEGELHAFGMRASGVVSIRPTTSPTSSHFGRAARRPGEGLSHSELRKHFQGCIKCCSRLRRREREVVPRGGFEPPTRGFSVRCSTN